MPFDPAHPFFVGQCYRNGHGVYEVLAVDYPTMRVRYEHRQVDTLQIPLQQRIRERLARQQAPQRAGGGISSPSILHRGALLSGDTGCLCCRQGTPKTGPRVCPAYDHTFRGNGWDGIDAH